MKAYGGGGDANSGCRGDSLKFSDSLHKLRLVGCP